MHANLNGKPVIETNSDEASVWPTYLKDTRVQCALVVAQRVATWNEDKLYGIKLHASEPDHMSATAFAVVHEHQKSCLALIRTGMVGSALALMRPSVEVFVRGLWLQWAEDDELSRFQKGEDSLNLERAIKLIVQRSGVKRYSDLKDMWMQSKRTLHGYTHHSYQSLVRRSGVINVSPEEIVSLLNFSSALATHASLEITVLAGKRALPEQEAERRDSMHKLQIDLVATLDALARVETGSKEDVRSSGV